MRPPDPPQVRPQRPPLALISLPPPASSIRSRSDRGTKLSPDPPAEKASDAQERRIRALERETRDLRAANAALRERMAEASEMTAAREREIARLSGKLQQERDLDRLALQYRNEASEKLVASLNAQIDVLSARAAELEEQVREERGRRKRGGERGETREGRGEG